MQCPMFRTMYNVVVGHLRTDSSTQDCIPVLVDPERRFYRFSALKPVGDHWGRLISRK